MGKERADRVELHGYSVKNHQRERKLNSRNRNYPFKLTQTTFLDMERKELPPTNNPGLVEAPLQEMDSKLSVSVRAK